MSNAIPLSQIGLNPNEAKVYTALLGLGECTSGPVVKHTHLHRTNVYDALARLCKMGLVSTMEKDNRRYFQCTHPENLRRLLTDKQQALDALMPKLKEMYTRTQHTLASITIVEGFIPFTHLLEGMLDKGEEFLLVNLPSQKIHVRTLLARFHNMRMAKGIDMRIVEGASADVSIIICGDEVAITTWTDDVSTLWIREQKIADLQRIFFEQVYNGTMAHTGLEKSSSENTAVHAQR